MAAFRNLFDLRLPFFAPLWRRVATVAVTAIWTVFELSAGNPGWAVLFGAITAYCVIEFFIVFDPANYREKDND